VSNAVVGVIGKLRTLGPDDPRTLVTLHTLASIYLDDGDTARAIPALEQVYAAKAKLLGPEHPDRLPRAIELLENAFRASVGQPSVPWIGNELMIAFECAEQPAAAAANEMLAQ